MIYKNLSNCLITKSAAQILLPYVDSTKSTWYARCNGFHTGIDITGSEIYHLCSGSVIALGKDADGFCVTVQYDRTQCVRYMHLKSVDCIRGDLVKQGEHLGTVDNYIHLEYCRNDVDTTRWPVRIDQSVYYKQDPEWLVTSDDPLPTGNWSSVDFADASQLEAFTFTPSTSKEFDSSDDGGDRGEQGGIFENGFLY